MQTIDNNTTTMYKGKAVQTIDATPTWEGMLAYYLLVLEDGNDEGKKVAKKELKNMARVADMLVMERKANKMLLNEIDTAFATLFIGSDHGITPQAWDACKEASVKVSIELDTDFQKWIHSDNVVKQKDGYREQSTQYNKLFPTISELYLFYAKEFKG